MHLDSVAAAPMRHTALVLVVLLASACGRAAGDEVPALVAAPAIASVDASEDVPAGMRMRRVQHLGDDYTVVSVDLHRLDLDLYGQTADEGAVHTIPELASWLKGRGRRLVMATNGGIFSTPNQPVGLHVERGMQRSPMDLGSGFGNFYVKPNGVFYVSTSGGSQSAHVVSSERFQLDPCDLRVATQSGPALLLHGQVNTVFSATSSSLKLRSGVGVWDADAHVVHFAISEGPVRFHDFATLFRDELGCTDALYLDGSISVLRAPGRHRPADDARRFAAILAVTEARPTP